MPAYAGNDLATLLRNNQQAYLWQNELVTAGGAATPPSFVSLSLAFQLERINRSHYPWGLSFEAIFTGAPGAFEIDIMGANNDLYTNYVQLGTITAVNGFNVGRWDMPTNVWPKYVAAYMKTLGNAVNVTLQVTH
jgi:hypothetical protein